MNWRSKKAVLALVGCVCLVIFGAGMAAAWHNRHTTICPNHQMWIKRQGGLLGQVEFTCPGGITVTTPG